MSQQRAPTAFHAPRPVPSAPVAATPLRALYAAGSGIIDLAFARFQHWLWHPLI
ncbi:MULTISPECIES: hypothetical protein [unclassified Streptomyces]|uniref:hypothetical protein n=1 Tax=unclassified Streptomyces TaxID=2593676 RepID=UPI0015A03302|nr:MULTISPECIES: hypothetical protein [unclassified Streptomyces]